MKKSKLGISVGLLGATVYFVALFGGYLPTVLLTAYILLCEENIWLRKSAIKTTCILIVFSIVTTVIGLIPDFTGFISDVAAIFGKYFISLSIDTVATALTSLINIIKTVTLTLLGISALNQSSVKIPFIDGFLERYL